MATDIIIAAVFFILGLIPTYYFYRKSIWIKEPVYSIKSVNVISGYSSVFPGLKVSYLDEPVENFTVSKILFFNAGAVTLDKDDIAKRNPLRIVTSSGKFLNMDALAINNPSSAFSLAFDAANNHIAINFEYLNQNDGVVLILMHTGMSSEDIEISGGVKEVTSIRRLAPNSLRIRPPNVMIAIAEIALFMMGALSFVILYYVWTGNIRFTDRFLVSIFSAMATTGLIVIGQKAWEMIRYRPGKIIPNGLEIFDSDYYAFPDRGQVKIWLPTLM